MVSYKVFYKVSVFRWKQGDPEILHFFHMSPTEMNDWIDNLLSDPSNDVSHVVIEEFKIYDYE